MIFRFRDELREGNDVESSLVETMTHAGHSVIVSGTTCGDRTAGDGSPAAALLRSMGIGGMLIHRRLRDRDADAAAGDARRASARASHRVRVMPRRFIRPRGIPRTAAGGTLARCS